MLEGIKINFEFDQKSLPPKCKFRTGKNLFKEFALLTENIFSTRQDRDSISLPRERFALRLTISYHFRKPVKKIVSQIQRKEINFTLMESTEKFKENLLTERGKEKRYHEEKERSNFETRVIQKASTSSLPFTRLEWRGRWIGFLEEGKRVHREFIASSYACPTSVSTSAERGERERPLMQMPDLHRMRRPAAATLLSLRALFPSAAHFRSQSYLAFPNIFQTIYHWI